MLAGSAPLFPHPGSDSAHRQLQIRWKATILNAGIDDYQTAIKISGYARPTWIL